MPTLIHELKVRSDGFPGAPGWTTFYFDGEDPTEYDNQFRRAKDWVDFIKGLEPSIWSAAVQTEGRVLQTSTGMLESITTIPADGTGDAIVGVAGGAAFSAGPAGICVSWTTGGVNRGRTVRGRTFVVPVSATVFEADGTIATSVLPALAPAALSWAVDDPPFGIWSRPVAGAGGAWFPVVSAHITDQAAILTSRR